MGGVIPDPSTMRKTTIRLNDFSNDLKTVSNKFGHEMSPKRSSFGAQGS